MYWMGCKAEWHSTPLFVMDEKKYWVGFNLIKGIGAVRMQSLIKHFDGLDAAWKAAPADLAAAGPSLKLIERIVKARDQVDLDKVWSKIEAQGIKILTWADEAYPQRLKEIEQPPPVLYLRGNYLPDDLFAVAIVGTRRVTACGRQITEELAAHLAGQGITVVSGLARGVDAIAHQTVLKAVDGRSGCWARAWIRSIPRSTASWQSVWKPVVPLSATMQWVRRRTPLTSRRATGSFPGYHWRL
jgi:predicted Rossmann fold nucleotide-binding protein DprA/Smf involved in DNA uptake